MAASDRIERSDWFENNENRSNLDDLNEDEKWEEVRSWLDFKAGDFVNVKYFGLWHAVLVTDTSGHQDVFKGIHYAWPGSGLSKLITRRRVQEDEFHVNVEGGDLWKVVIPESRRVPHETAILYAQEKVGEKRFNMFTRRSSHVVRECVIRNQHSD